MYGVAGRERLLLELPTAMWPAVELLGTHFDCLEALKVEAEAGMVKASNPLPIWRVIETILGHLSGKALPSLRHRMKHLTRRRGGGRLRIIAELRRMLLGCRAYIGFVGEVPSPSKDREKKIHCRLRCYAWKQWGRRGYQELRRRWGIVRPGVEHVEVGARCLVDQPEPGFGNRAPGAALP